MTYWYLIAAIVVFISLGIIWKIRKDNTVKSEKKNAQLLSSFEGLYEILYEAASGQMPKKIISKTLRDWNRRITLEGDTAMRRRWIETFKEQGYNTDMSLLSTADIVKLQNIAKNWLEYMQSLGAKRDCRENLILDAASSALYDLEESYNNGVQVQVLIPCWTYKESAIILQKGSAVVVR